MLVILLRIETEDGWEGVLRSLMLGPSVPGPYIYIYCLFMIHGLLIQVNLIQSL